MRRVAWGASALLLASVWGALVSVDNHVSPPAAPVTRTDDVKDVLHGVTIADPYRWLEDQNSAETRAWIDAQNRYTHALVDPLPVREPLKHRLAQLMRVDQIDLPYEAGGRLYYTRRKPDQEQPVLCMREGLHGDERVVVDPNPMSPDHTTSAGLRDLSSDGTLIAYEIRKGGEDETTIRFFSPTSAAPPESLARARYFGFAMVPDKSAVYYTRQEDAGPRLYFHKLKTDPARDPLIFGERLGSRMIVEPSVSEDSRYLAVNVSEGSAPERTQIYYADIRAGEHLKPLVTDIQARFFPIFAGDQLLLLTNWQAPKMRVLAVDLAHPQRDRWRELIPQGPNTIEVASAAAGHIFVNYLDNVHSRVEEFDPKGHHLRTVTLPALGSAGPINGRWDSRDAFFTFTSFHIPLTIFHYQTTVSAQEIWARVSAPVNSDALVLEQQWYRSKDGTAIPMFLLHRKDFALNGRAPALLFGYGGFNVNITPFFYPQAVTWAERGGIFAVANLRGGGEFGESWHRAGMQAHKQNVFDDFTAAAQTLIAQRYTSPAHLAILGGSNGGLLVGAAITQHPELFRAAICAYPLLDMLRYQKFLVAQFWVPEYGSADDPQQFRYLLAYSPYQNVRPGTKYPAVMFLTGDSDTRVAPLHARKMTARLQVASASGLPIVLLYDTASGHSGGKPLTRQIDDASREMAFLWWQTTMAQ